MNIISADAERPASDNFDDLLLREMSHRSSNDMQLVASLLALQSRNATSDETRKALDDVADRVMILALARAAFLRDSRQTLHASMHQVCIALQSLAAPHGILVSFESEELSGRISQRQIMALALAINELATNAIKHAFEDGQSGRINIQLVEIENFILTLTVEDDGKPFIEPTDGISTGLGLPLVRRLIEMCGGLILLPENGRNRFEIRVPLSEQ